MKYTAQAYLGALLLFTLLFGGCVTETKESTKNSASQSTHGYVDFKRFKEGRPCAEVAFMCLPESRDKSWQSVPTKDRIEDFELTPEVMRRRQAIVQRWRDEEDGKV